MITVNDVLNAGFTIDVNTGSLYKGSQQLSDRLWANELLINGNKEYIVRSLLVYYYSHQMYDFDISRDKARTILFIDGNRSNLSASNLIHIDDYISDNSLIQHPSIPYIYANRGGKVFNYNLGVELGSINSYGYRVVKVHGKVYQAHRLVYECITQSSIPEELTINHIDANKLNNSFSNLELLSRGDNTRESNTRNREARIGEQHPGSKLTKEMVIDIYLSTLPSSIMANKYGVSATQILHIRTNKLWVEITRDLEQPIYDKLPGKTKLDKEQVTYIFTKVYSLEDRKKVAQEYGVSLTTIDDIIKKRTWRSVTDKLNRTEDL